MYNYQTVADKTAISLSLLCVIHCLLLPTLLVLLPSIAALGLGDEAFHQWLVFIALPLSLITLGMGCRKHKNTTAISLGISGLLLMVGAIIFGHDFLGEIGEKGLTVLGAGLVASAHWKNHRLCQKHACEECGRSTDINHKV